LISYGNNIVASIQPEYRTIVEEYISKYAVEHCFETLNMHVLNDAFEKYDYRICFMAEYFLPDLDRLQEQPCEFELRVLSQEDFKDLYLPEWSNIKSVRNAIRAGFKPAWVEMTVKSKDFVEKMNRG